MAKHEGRARNIAGAPERSRNGRDERRLPGAEFPFECDHVARPERPGEVGGRAFEGGKVGRRDALPGRHRHDAPEPVDRPAEELPACNAKGSVMWWRANDVVVGVITGVFSAVVAALFEAFFVTTRFLSLGQHGGGIGSKIFFIAIVGAIVGGIVGFFVGAVIKPRPQPR
jgi:hypothetical protein